MCLFELSNKDIEMMIKAFKKSGIILTYYKNDKLCSTFCKKSSFIRIFFK